MITLKKIGMYEVTLMKDLFGRYLCRFWKGNEYTEGFNKNKFTAFREAKLKISKSINYRNGDCDCGCTFNHSWQKHCCVCHEILKCHKPSRYRTLPTGGQAL